MSSVAARVRHRVNPAPSTAVVALGDLCCIAAFVVVGAASGHDIDPVAAFGRVTATFATFALGWSILALLAGLYTPAVLGSPRDAIARIGAGWAGAALVAQALRATSVFPGNAAVTFYLVSVGVGLALLVPWRLAIGRFAPTS